MKRFFEWLWFRKYPAYKRKYLSLKIVKILNWRTFLVDNHDGAGRMTVQKLMPWERQFWV